MELRSRDFTHELDEVPRAPSPTPSAPDGFMIRRDWNDPQWDERVVPYLFHLTDEPLRALREAVASWDGDRAWAHALAALAVTGRLAHLHWQHHRPSVDDIVKHSTPPMRRAAEDVLEFVDRVEEYLELPGDERAGSALSDYFRTRGHPSGALPWLAVCAEQDPPWRPVNALASCHRAKSVSVSLGDETATVRYIEKKPPNASGAILLLHGLGSRLEEGDELATVLADEYGYHVVAMDFPGQGYTSHVHPTLLEIDVHRRPQWDLEASFQFLPKLDRFIESFVSKLGLDDELVAIAGGSLGGTMALRMAMKGRPKTTNELRYIAWSPGSCWGTQQTNIVNRMGIEKRVQRRLRNEEVIVEHPTLDNARRDTRHDYHYWVYEETIPCSGEPAELWFREGMPHFDAYVEQSRHDRREVYSEAFRRWTLGLAYEQTYYSFHTVERGHTDPHYARIEAPVLLMAGQKDDKALDIHAAVQQLGEEMGCPGWTYSVPETGHSFHSERPRLLGKLIGEFLDHPFRG